MAAVIFCVDRRGQHGRGAGLERRDAGGGRRQRRRADPVRERRPAQGQAPSAEARRLIEQGGTGLQVPPQPAGLLPERPAGVSALRGDRRGRADRALPHRSRPGSGSGHAGRRRDPAEVLQPDARRRRRRRLPGPADHPGAPVLPLAGGGAQRWRCTSRRSTSTCPAGRRSYFPPILVQYVNTLLRHKMLFGSDYPVLTPERWLAEFADLPIRDEVRPASSSRTPRRCSA